MVMGEPPVNPPPEGRKRKWKTEKYAVQQPFVREILEKLQIRPTVDAFSSANSKRFERWWGPGSADGTDAFAQDWSREVLWLNPPFSMFARVVDKLERDGAHAILVMPEWPRQAYFHRAKALEVSNVLFPEGTHLFEMNGEPVPAIQWPVFAMLVCGDLQNCPLHCCPTKKAKEQGEVTVSTPRGKCWWASEV